MWPFKNKVQYKVTWKYEIPKYYYTEVVKAYSESHAWRLLKRGKLWPISLLSLEELQ